MAKFTTRRKKALQAGIPFEITRDEFLALMAADMCDICGGKEFDEQGCGDMAHSIDRIDNRKGYVPGNCQAAHVRCNQVKARTEWLPQRRRPLRAHRDAKSDIMVKPPGERW